MRKNDESRRQSPQTVKSSGRKGKTLTILFYLAVWAAAMAAFWFFTDGSDDFGYSLLYLWILLPAVTFAVSLIIGKNNYWGRKKWAAAPVLGVMYMLLEYGTFSMANNLAFDKVNMPNWNMLAAGALISLTGLGIGHWIWRRKMPG